MSGSAMIAWTAATVAPVAAARLSAASALASVIAARRARGWAATEPAWMRPIRPAPRRPMRTGLSMSSLVSDAVGLPPSPEGRESAPA
jgi:hypothetical protein